jgi:hypothetical protein
MIRGSDKHKPEVLEVMRGGAAIHAPPQHLNLLVSPVPLKFAQPPREVNP